MLLTSLFDNLVSNSIKALDNSGEICVTIDSLFLVTIGAVGITAVLSEKDW